MTLETCRECRREAYLDASKIVKEECKTLSFPSLATDEENMELIGMSIEQAILERADALEQDSNAD